MSLDDNTKPSMGMSLSSTNELKRTRSLKQQHKQLSLQGQTSLNKQEITNDERELILKSDHFQDFFSRSSRLIERYLWESPQAFSIFTDYSGRDTDGLNGRMDVGEIIKFDREFYDERWTRHRIVTCIDTSTYHPELVLASYSQNDESTHESDGVVLIWNTKYKSKPTPEYIFNCQSWVTSCVFSKFHPNILLGGTYSGQIVVWDTRTNKRTPVQRTALSASSHTHPVYCLQVIGTQNANNLISISNEGKMCSWNIEMMTQPQESMDLAYRTKPVAATRMVFPGVEVNNFIIGSEEGQAYSGSRHGNKAGIQESYEGHFGPITGLSCHNVNGSIDFSSLFLTSSFDWSVKLWSLKESKPLNSFEVNSDYVTDVRWSPVHPSVFLTCDITGRFDIWNLNHDSELPLKSTTIDGNVALNKCLWSQNGQQIILGDDQGKLRLYDVNEFLTNPKPDDFNKLSSTLQDFKRNTLDAFDDNHPTSVSTTTTGTSSVSHSS
jgi:dynein intermediate chain